MSSRTKSWMKTQMIIKMKTFNLPQFNDIFYKGHSSIFSVGYLT